VGVQTDSQAATGFAYSGTELESFAQASNYYRWILGLMEPYLQGQVLEIGAGLGTVGDRLAALPAVRETVLLEPADNLYARLAGRFRDVPNVKTVQGYFGRTDLPRDFDAIVLINVLEHIQDHVTLIGDAYQHLRPGGALLLFVPAMQWLYGSLDAEFEHFRRYGRGPLVQLLRQPGFSIVQLRYMHAVGVLGWLLAGKVLRKTTISPASMRAYDRFVIPWVSRVESWVRAPFGQSLLAIAVKPEEG